MLRDNKTYSYIKFTAAEKYPRLYFTRRIPKDGSLYFGPYFPASLARRILHFVHKRFLVPSCTVDLTRTHPRPCLQYYIHRCLGPCVAGLTTDERYAEAAHDVKMLLEGRRHDLIRSLEQRMGVAAEKELFEQAASYRDLLRTLEDIEERQRIAAAQGDDTDVLAYHAEPPLVAANLFHLRGGRVVDRREFYWEDLEAFDAQEFVPSLLKQLYLEAEYLPKAIHVPEEFEDRELLKEMLSERAGHGVEIFTPQRGQKKAILDLVQNNAAHSFEQRFRVLKPTSKAIGEALQNALNLVEEPERIECFDISHIQGSDTVASMVVWEKGRMKKSDYRKFIIRGEQGANNRPAGKNGEAAEEPKTRHSGEWRSQENGGGTVVLPVYKQNDDFASMREVVTRRYRRLQEEKKAMPGLILIDGGIGQLHAAAEALDALGIINQPLASIAKKEEILYVYGQENEPIVLERH
jgi:excinuclease ABC subunit C